MSVKITDKPNSECEICIEGNLIQYQMVEQHYRVGLDFDLIQQ